MADYDESIKKIIAEKKKVDQEINRLQNQASELEYEQTLKKLALVEKWVYDNQLWTRYQ